MFYTKLRDVDLTDNTAVGALLTSMFEHECRDMEEHELEGCADAFSDMLIAERVA